MLITLTWRCSPEPPPQLSPAADAPRPPTIILLNYFLYTLAGETSEESQRKRQVVNIEAEREQRVEDRERNEQNECNVEHRATRGHEREEAGYGKQRDTEKEAERKSTGDTKGKERPDKQSNTGADWKRVLMCLITPDIWRSESVDRLL